MNCLDYIHVINLLKDVCLMHCRAM